MIGAETQRRRATRCRLEHGRDHVRFTLWRLADFRPRPRRQVWRGQRPDGRFVSVDRLHFRMASRLIKRRALHHRHLQKRDI